jgi:hypothetical protein
LVVRAVLPATSQIRPQLRTLAQGAADQLQLAGADRVHLAWLAASTADIARLGQRIRQLDQRIPSVLARLGCTLTEEQPAKDYVAAKRAEHKTAREARRAHKRLLASVVIRRMWADQQRRRSRTLNVPNQTTPTAA